MFKRIASSNTTSFVKFNFFINFVYFTGLFPFTSRYSYKPTDKRSSISPPSGLPESFFSDCFLHDLQYLSVSLRKASHWVYRPWFFMMPLQHISFFTFVNGNNIDDFFLFSTFSFFTFFFLFKIKLEFSIFNFLIASSSSKLYSKLHAFTVFFATSLDTSSINFTFNLLSLFTFTFNTFNTFNTFILDILY